MLREQLLTLVETVCRTRYETRTLELKAAHKGAPTRLFDTLSSFSNQDDGGVILFGLSEEASCEVIGVYDPQDLQRRVTEQCKQMQPVVRPLFTLAEVSGNIVVSAEIPGSDVADRPVYYKGAGRVKGSYIRVGESDEPMTDYEIYSYDAYRRRVRDDIRIAELADVTQLEPPSLDSYIDAIKTNRPHTAKIPSPELLEFMGITRGGKPTLSGVLCFSRYPQAAFPQLCVTAVVVPGIQIGDMNEEGARFLDNKRIEGTIAEMLDESMRFVQRNMRQITIIGDDGRRQDRTEYPVTAVREAVLNALMHRDYSIHTEGSPIRVQMYNDRMEIINEGGLYGKLTVDSLGKTHADTRNQTLAQILEVQKVAENRYSGIPTIRAEMMRYNLPAPIFEVKRGNFIVTLQNDTAKTEGGSVRNLLTYLAQPRSREDIAAFLRVSSYYAIKTFITPLIESGKVHMTIPGKPRSKNQRFYAAD